MFKAKINFQKFERLVQRKRLDAKALEFYKSQFGEDQILEIDENNTTNICGDICYIVKGKDRECHFTKKELIIIE